jgi:hypothetical protein
MISLKKTLGASAVALSLAGKSITPRGSRITSPSIVARFNSVSVIASGFVKLVLNSVMTACRSAGLNELIKSSVVGLAEGEGDDNAGADGLAEAAGLAGGITVGGGVCASALIAMKKLMKDNDVN